MASCRFGSIKAADTCTDAMEKELTLRVYLNGNMSIWEHQSSGYLHERHREAWHLETVSQ